MPYHVRITNRTNRSRDELALDLDEETLLKRFVQPYLEGAPITTGGTTIPGAEIERIRINRTERTSAELIPAIQAERRARRSFTIVPDEWHVTEKGENLTDDFITGPPGSQSQAYNGSFESSTNDGAGGTPETDLRRVFVVHGRKAQA